MLNKRSFWELGAEELKKLAEIKTIDSLDAKFLSTEMCDGLPCATMNINGIEFTLYDLDTDEAASLMNPSFTDAKQSILKRVQSLLAASKAEAEELDDEDTFENENEYDDSYGGGDSYGGSY